MKEPAGGHSKFLRFTRDSHAAAGQQYGVEKVWAWIRDTNRLTYLNILTECPPAIFAASKDLHPLFAASLPSGSPLTTGGGEASCTAWHYI